MAAHNTKNHSNQKQGWEILAASPVEGARASQIFRRVTEAGTLVVFEPATPSSHDRYCATFPGFTGDAVSHVAFIRAALDADLGVVCVTPKWGNSTRRMRENAQALFTGLYLGPLHPSQILFVRGVSFGAYLTLPWLAQHDSRVEKVGLVAPCSADHLTHAAIQMKIDLLHDDRDYRPLEPRQSPNVRVLALEKDAIVPETDQMFLGLSSTTEHRLIARGDHFTAGEEPEASVELAAWFGERDGS